MNVLPLEKKALVLSHLVEGNSIRATVRLTGVSKKAVMRLLVEAGERARDIQDSMMINLKCNYIQIDEQWGFIAKKQKRASIGEQECFGYGDQYTFIAMDSETKLVPVFKVGLRNYQNALSMMKELQARVVNRFQLSSDAFAPYFNAVDTVFGADIDYGQIHKNYGEEPTGQKRYSPAQIISIKIKPLIGEPKRSRISTSHIERQNLTIRMQMRRFTRLTNGFSKKLKNHECAIALHFYHYNFMRIHQSLRVTPAMQAKITNRLWDWQDLLVREAIAA